MYLLTNNPKSFYFMITFGRRCHIDLLGEYILTDHTLPLICSPTLYVQLLSVNKYKSRCKTSALVALLLVTFSPTIILDKLLIDFLKSNCGLFKTGTFHFNVFIVSVWLMLTLHLCCRVFEPCYKR